MPSSVPAAKTGLRAYLASVTGLREADGVRVSSAPVAPEELTNAHVTLGDTPAPRAREGMGIAETPTLAGWIHVGMVAGSDEAAIAKARDAAAGLLNLIDVALTADPTAAGTIRPPGGLLLSSSTLSEGPGEDNQVGTRWANYTFQISWTSHIT